MSAETVPVDHPFFPVNALPFDSGLEQFCMVQSMMKTHLDLTLAEAVAYLKGDYDGSVKSYEQVHLEILGMADPLSSGIIAQFPTQFHTRLHN